jgi:prolactin regulatory element-binding protein
MSKGVSYTKLDLAYPPWALDFDPYNRGYLLVGGGGGEGQKEVPNRLTLLDISSPHAIERVAELPTSIEEDCPVSLGVLSTTSGFYAFAGLNSGTADRQKGTNKHFRTFRVDFPVRSRSKNAKQSQGKIVPLGQISLFSRSFAEEQGAFQRLLRLSPAKRQAYGSKRIGAIASSLSKESEIILFNATNALPTDADKIQTIKPLQNAEANDIDIFEVDEGQFLVAFCTNTEIYATPVSYDFSRKRLKKSAQEPKAVFSASLPGASPKMGRPKIRSLRFLTPHHLLILSNRRSQSELQILNIDIDGSDSTCVLRKQLPQRMGSAVSLDVCLLDPDVATGARQIIVAIAAQSQDVQIYTIDYSGLTTDIMSTFRLYSDLRDVHTMAMKKVVLEPFQPPGLAKATSSPNKRKRGQASSTEPHYIHRASISLSNTIVVESLPLQRLDTKKPGSRYILSKGGSISDLLSKYANLTAIGFALVITLLLLQSFLNAQAAGDNPSLQLLPRSLQNYLGLYSGRAGNITSPYLHKVERAADPYVHSQTANRLRDLLHLHHHRRNLPDAEKKAIIVRASEDGSGELSTEVHADTAALLKKDVTAKKWEELTEHQQRRWKERLIKAGEWAESEGETILKGVFWSEFAETVGHAAAEAIAGLGHGA